MATEPKIPLKMRSAARREELAIMLQLSRSVLQGSVAVATLIAGFTFNTLLGQSFQPRDTFTNQSVQLLLALTFLFSVVAVLVASFVLWTEKLILRMGRGMWQWGRMRSSCALLAASVGALTMNSASFVTLSLAITAFQKVVGAIIVGITSWVALYLVILTIYYI